MFVGLLGELCANEAPGAAAAKGDSGFSQPLPGSSGFAVAGGFDEAADLLSGVSAGFSASSFYDSNLNRGAGSGAVPLEDDFVQSLSSSVQWARNSSLWNLSLGTSGSYELPLNTPEFKSFDYGFNGAAGYRAGRLKLGVTLDQSFNNGSNRFYGGVVRQASYGVGFSAAYELSPKTSLVSTYHSIWTDGGGDVTATEERTGNLSAMWKYSPLLQFGPGLGYSEDSSASLDARTSIGPTLSANYQLSRKVSIQGMLGWEFTSGGNNDDGGSAPFLSSSISASYALNRLWGFGLSLNRGVEAEGFANVGFRESTALAFSVTHRVGRANAALALGYDHTDYLVSQGSSTRPGIDYVTSSISLSTPIIGDRVSATVFVRYVDSVSDDLSRNWDCFQTGCSLGYQF